MQRIECKGRVPLAKYFRQVSESGITVCLVDVLNKPVAGGAANVSKVRTCLSGNDLIIQPA